MASVAEDDDRRAGQIELGDRVADRQIMQRC